MINNCYHLKITHKVNLEQFMVPYLHFEIVPAGNDFTDKQTMTDKQFLRYTNTDKVILK